MGQACRGEEAAVREGVELDAAVVDDAAVDHMAEALEVQRVQRVQEDHLPLIPRGGRRVRHMEGWQQSAGSQAGWGARRKMAACRTGREWLAHTSRSDEE